MTDTLSDDSYFDFFYPTNQEKLSSLWRDPTTYVAVDSNVLLNLHRVQAREKLFHALVELGERLWIPFHVAVEYHLARDSQIAGQRASLEEFDKFLKSTTNKLGKFEKLRDMHVDFDPTSMLSNLEKALQDAGEIVQAHISQIPRAEAESMVPRVRGLLLGRVGPQLKQQEIDEIQEQGQARFEAEWPPGYQDRKKKERVRRWQHWGGLRFDPIFGDLIIWKELLRNFKGKSLIWVSSDSQKGDWVEYRYGRQCPRRELLFEARDAGLEHFWIFHTRDLLENLSDASTDELEDVVAVNLNTEETRRHTLDANSALVLDIDDRDEDWEVLDELLSAVRDGDKQAALERAEYLFYLFERAPDLHPHLETIMDWARSASSHKQVGRKVYDLHRAAEYAAELVQDALGNVG